MIRARSDLKPVDFDWRRVWSDVGIEDVLSALEFLMSGMLFVKCAARFDQPKDAPIGKSRMPKGLCIDNLERAIEPDVLDACLASDVDENPEILRRKIVTADAPVHEPLADLHVSRDDDRRPIFRSEFPDFCQGGTADVVKPAHLSDRCFECPEQHSVLYRRSAVGSIRYSR